MLWRRRSKPIVCVPDPNSKYNMGLWIAGDNLVQWRGNFPKIWGKRDVTHLIYAKIKPYHFLCCFAQRQRGFKLFPQQKVSDKIKFQNASKRQIKIIYFYVIKTPMYKIIAGDSQTHIISNLGLGRRLSKPDWASLVLFWYAFGLVALESDNTG